MDVDGISGGNGINEPNSAHPESKDPEPPATQFPEGTWKNIPPAPRTEYAPLDDRLLQELKYMGLISPAEVPDHTSSMDDEVASRLRYLQSELKRQSIVNGARKARLLDLTEEWMAKQEYTTIADDLDNQINAAYLKRNRNISKKGKQIKRPGGAGGGSHVVGVARPGTGAGHGGVGEPIRGLMERKKKWNEWIGPVVGFGKTWVPRESVFGKEEMARLMAREAENWGEEPEV
jgi:transcriptional adapter 3